MLYIRYLEYYNKWEEERFLETSRRAYQAIQLQEESQRESQ